MTENLTSAARAADLIATETDRVRRHGAAVPPHVADRAETITTQIIDDLAEGKTGRALAAVAALSLDSATAEADDERRRGLPYADADIEAGRTVLDTRRLAEAVPDGARRIAFLAQERYVFKVVFEVDWLDEYIPNWRAVLADPGNHDVPGRGELEEAMAEDMRSGDEIGGITGYELVPIDRTPVHIQIHDTKVYDYTTTADELDARAPGWRDGIDAAEPHEALPSFALNGIADVISDQCSDTEPTETFAREIRSITQ